MNFYKGYDPESAFHFCPDFHFFVQALIMSLKAAGGHVDIPFMTEIIKPKVLVCSDQPNFLQQSDLGLSKHYDVQYASTKEMVDFLANEWEPKLALFDGDSRVCEALPNLRNKFGYSRMGIFVVSQNYRFLNEVNAFRQGADQYLGGSIDPQVVISRLKALSLRMESTGPEDSNHFAIRVRGGSTAPQNLDPLSFGDILIFPNDFLIKLENRILPTTPTQFKLMLAFVSNKEKLLSRNWIREEVWNNADISPRSIDAQISKLKKLIPQMEKHLVNVYGKGYILTTSHRDVA